MSEFDQIISYDFSVCAFWGFSKKSLSLYSIFANIIARRWKFSIIVLI